MDPILLQQQLKENATDLEYFYKDLKNWGDEMKRKNDSPKKPTIDSNAVKKQKTKKSASKDKQPVRRIGSTDYSKWDKFDAEAECEKVDYNENDESDLTDECDDNLREEALLHKEKGNKFVKEKKWEEAIEYYTKAIDCFAYDPVFYANRALCFLKTNNFTKAESDCNLSIKLDNSYVKAYQRRAAAREALNKLEEAEFDLLNVLELEPKNNESKISLENIRKKMEINNNLERPISKFSATRNLIKTQKNQKIDDSKCNGWADNDNIVLVKPINKYPHLRSKKPLKRIEITEMPTENAKITACPKENETDKVLKLHEFKVIEKIQTNSSHLNASTIGLEKCVPPKTSVQFYSTWKLLNDENKYNYLKLIDPKEITHIFRESLESYVFSEILEILVNYFVKNEENVSDWLLNLSEVKRFSTLTLFMNANDKNCLWKLIDFIKKFENKEKNCIDVIVKKYEL